MYIYIYIYIYKDIEVKICRSCFSGVGKICAVNHIWRGEMCGRTGLVGIDIGPDHTRPSPGL